MTCSVKYVINPFTGEFDAITNPDHVVEAITTTRFCDVSTVVGDLVLESETIVNGVDSTVDNTDIRPVFGIVISKESTTSCTVLLVGTIQGFSGLTKARKVFLGTDGSPTSTVVATGYLQCLGNARDVDTIDFNPQLNRILRV